MSAFEKITDTISEIEMSEDTAETLMQEMSAFAINNRTTFSTLMRIPAFRHLWEALEESAIFSTRGHDVPDFIAKRHGIQQAIAELRGEE